MLWSLLHQMVSASDSGNEVAESVYEGDREKPRRPTKPLRPLPSSTKKATKAD